MLARALPPRGLLGGYGAPAGRRKEEARCGADFLLADGDGDGGRGRFATCAALQVFRRFSVAVSARDEQQ